MIGWLLLAGILLFIGLLFPLLRARAARRQRSQRWNDLRQRSQLFASQLRHLQDVTGKRNVPPTPPRDP
jgi:hypothetical protein